MTYAQPGGTTPVEATLRTEAITITGIVPQGAEGPVVRPQRDRVAGHVWH